MDASTSIDIQFRDGSKNKVNVFRSSDKNAPLFICLPAMGARAGYYEPFAVQLEDRGYNVVTVDWRGIGNSSIRASRKVDFGYIELIADLKETMDLIQDVFPSNQKLLIGHSLGGQIGSLFISRYPYFFEGLILIASSLVYYKGWQGFDSWKVKLAGYLFYPLSVVVGYLPGKAIGFGGREARSVMKDWSHNALTGSYEGIDEDYDYESSLRKIMGPVLSISIENDFLASRQAVKNLYGKFNPQAIVNHVHINEKDSGIKHLDHFNWVKKPDYIINLIEKWLNECLVLNHKK